MITTESKDDNPKSGNGARLGWLRVLFVDLPFALLFLLLAVSLVVQRAYLTYVVPIAQSYKRGEMNGDFYENYDNHFTYYNRHCGPEDISTRSAGDLLIHEDYTGTQAANVMLEHGAVAFQNVLSNDTASELRAYLAQKHHEKESLGYNEVMWDEISRLSLGIGTNDHPTVIAEAMQQVGTHPVVKRTLEGILGPDPAIVEISTLTSLNGAEDQGLHTDSDWFGSSLLYSRNFLHSYSMFISLQDSSRVMGATTVCPGSHYCADMDLEEMCLENGAFEVSTNGHTGEHGVLRKGDAFLFNQNVWHRGPKNEDPDGMDRFMFIMTFASAKDVAADRRRQGLGTYYYQRFNMWGSTFSMLKDAKTKMIQPFAGLRALGLVKTRGITWIHQFCQQFANGDEFYDDHELEDLLEKLFNYFQVPTFLKSKSEQWKDFIPQTMALWVDFISFVNAAAFTVYCIMCALVRAVRGKEQSGSTLVQLRPVLLAASVWLITQHLNEFIDQTELAQSVTTGDVFVKPFPTENESLHVGPTTLPERHDVLISTRFDADFLASFNRFLDFHPGNRNWQGMITAASSLPNNLLGPASKSIVRDILGQKEAGLSSRFLLQDPSSGYWSILSEDEASKETQRALLGRGNPLIGALSTQAKYLLSDSRFGVNRGTAMASLTEELLSDHWMAVLHGEVRNTTESTTNKRSANTLDIKHSFPSLGSLGNPKDRPSTLKERLNLSFLPAKEAQDDSEELDDVVDDIQIGSKIWVFAEREGQWYEGRLAEFLDDDEYCLVYFYNGGTFEEVHLDDIRPYLQVKSGDKVVVDYHGNFEEYFPGTVTDVHPDGRCRVKYDDGEIVEKVGREQMLPPEPDFESD